MTASEILAWVAAGALSLERMAGPLLSVVRGSAQIRRAAADGRIAERKLDVDAAGSIFQRADIMMQRQEQEMERQQREIAELRTSNSNLQARIEALEGDRTEAVSLRQRLTDCRDRLEECEGMVADLRTQLAAPHGSAS